MDQFISQDASDYIMKSVAPGKIIHTKFLFWNIYVQTYFICVCVCVCVYI